ncbi:MAG TPA: alpha amylase C-terminal domain-containing protein, partial [Gemmataceae bacterium]|nr:alpha amylase C-terminal domain-containing protein [Gemmataceae bacterium]
AHDPIHRQYHHNELLFRMVYAFTENYALPLSHDEVVHGKGSLLAKMPGDAWQQFANLRVLYGYLFGQPGKKLLFMGSEWGQGPEWNHDTSLDWHQLEHPLHAGVQQWVADLNRLYRTEPALHDQDCVPQGFAWIDCNDSAASVISFVRKGAYTNEIILVLANFTPVPRPEYQVGVPFGGFWKEVLNGDASQYGGSGVGNAGGVLATATPWQGQPYSLTLTVPPLAVVFFKGTGPSDAPLVPSRLLGE